MKCSKLKKIYASFDIVIFVLPSFLTICFIVLPPPLIDEQRLRVTESKVRNWTQGLTMTFFGLNDNMIYVHVYSLLFVCLDIYIICCLYMIYKSHKGRTFFLKPRLVFCKSRFGPSWNCRREPTRSMWFENYCWWFLEIRRENQLRLVVYPIIF